MKTKNLVVAGVSVKSGEKKAVIQEFPVNGHPFKLPMFLINGSQEGATLVVTGGIHAAEYASIAAALEVGQNLQPESLSGQVIVIPVVNMPGFSARSIYVCPLDGINLNRVFPGKPNGGASEQIAHWVFENAIKQGDCYVDLHGGDLVEALTPFTIFHRTGNLKVDDASLEYARVFGIQYLVASESIGSTFSAACEAGVPGILTEAGGQGIWHRSDVNLHVDGLNRLMRHLGMLAGGALPRKETQVLEKFIWLRSEFDGFYYPEVQIANKVSQGQKLGKITDFQGNVLQTVIAPESGTVLFLVSSLAINKNDPLISIGA
jgi:uncharacterized protein